MIPREENELRAPVSEAEKTLRLVASLPAPVGLGGRVQDGLRAAPHARLLEWPTALVPGSWIMSPVLRGAAAAVIVCIVAGGGWRIFSHVQAPAAPTAKVVVMPARVGSQGAFSNAGAMRTPDTLAKPVLTHAVTPEGTNPAGRTAPRHKTRHHAAASAQPALPR